MWRLFFECGEGGKGCWHWREVGRCWIGYSDIVWFFFFFQTFLETFFFFLLCFVRFLGIFFFFFVLMYRTSYVEYDIYLTHTTSRTSEISNSFFFYNTLLSVFMYIICS